jgi:hypothetical protein
LIQKPVHDVAADEAGPARDENTRKLHHVFSDLLPLSW